MLYIGQFKPYSILFYDINMTKRWGTGITRTGILANDFLIELTESMIEL